MSIEVHLVARMRVYPEASFASDASSSPGIASFTDVPFREGTAQVTLTTDELDPMSAQQSRLQIEERVLGKRSATLAFTMNLAPTGVAAVSGTSATTSALGEILKAVCGGESKNDGTTATTGSTATVVNCTNTAGAAKFAVGKVVGWVNSSGILETREIEQINTNALTLKHALSGSPASSDVLYNCVTYYPTEDPSSSLQFLVQGVETEDRWLLLGGQCVGGFTISTDPSGAAIPTITFNFTFASYKRSGEAAGTINGAIGTATYSNYQPIVGHAGEARMWTVGASTLTTSSRIHASAISFAPKVTYVPVTSPNGTNTVYRWRATRTNPPIDGSITTFFEDYTWWTARDSRTDHNFQYQLGTSAGSTVVLTAPTVQILNPQRVDAGGIAGQTINFVGRRDTDVGSSTSALAKAPWRIHFV